MFPIACFLILSGFLGCLGLFALAVTKVVAPDGRGHARGPLSGLAAMLALFLLCALGLAGLGVTALAIGVGSLAEWNPIRRIEIQREQQGSRDEPSPAERSTPEARQSESAVSARITVRADASAELVELLRDLADVDLAALGDDLTVYRQVDESGEEFAVYELRLPVSEAELECFEREAGSELDGLDVRLPERVDVEFRGPRGGPVRH